MQNMGWICPRCGTSNAPFVRSCEGCRPTAAAPIDVESVDAKSAGERLAAARAAKGFETATAAACALGWNVNTYRSAENGSRGIKAAKAKMYSIAFGVDPMWLLFGNEEDDSEVVERISLKDARKAKGMGQGELAMALGVSVQAVSQWEAGANAPKTENFLKLASLLGVSPENLQITSVARP